MLCHNEIFFSFNDLIYPINRIFFLIIDGPMENNFNTQRGSITESLKHGFFIGPNFIFKGFVFTNFLKSHDDYLMIFFILFFSFVDNGNY